MKRLQLTKIITLFLIAASILTFAGCSVKIQAIDLMENIEPEHVEGKEPDDRFIYSAADFSVELFKKSYDKSRSSLVSPLSVMIALAMAANGTDNESLSQIESIIGGDIKLNELNKYLYSYINALPDSDKAHFNIANSLWIKDSYAEDINKDFLQYNKNYYNASVYKTPFNKQTVKDINSWVKRETDGAIKDTLKSIGHDEILYIINAITFEAEWSNPYKKDNIKKEVFVNIDNKEKTAEMMHSNEYSYIENEDCIGFIKPYAGNTYSFAALLPNEGIQIEKFIDSLTGNIFIDILRNSDATAVDAAMPKFSYDYNINLESQLIDMGIKDIFSIERADLSKTFTERSFVSDIIHKTYIQVDGKGTKAGAVTNSIVDAGAMPPREIKNVKLDRPFVYAIIDNATKLPIFIGAVLDV